MYRTIFQLGSISGMGLGIALGTSVINIFSGNLFGWSPAQVRILSSVLTILGFSITIIMQVFFISKYKKEISSK